MNEDLIALIPVAVWLVIMTGFLGYYFLRGRKRKQQFTLAAEGLGGRRVKKFLRGACVEFPAAEGRKCMMWVQERNRYAPEMLFLEQEHSLEFKFTVDRKGSILTRDLGTFIGLGKKKINLPPEVEQKLIIRSSDVIKAEFHFNNPQRLEAALGLVAAGFGRVAADRKKIKATLKKFRDMDLEPDRLRQYGEWLSRLV